MTRKKLNSKIDTDWPARPDGRHVVLHARVLNGAHSDAEHCILLSAAYLADSDYWLSAAYIHPQDHDGVEQLVRRAEHSKLPVITLPDRGPLDQSLIRRLLKICKHYKVRIWHSHDHKSNLLGLTLRPFWAMNLVSTVHDQLDQATRTPLYSVVDRWCLPYYHHVLCMSEDLSQRITKIGVQPDRLSLIYNAIDDKTFTRTCPPKQSSLRTQGPGQGHPPVPDGRVVIGAHGPLTPDMGFGNLIRAAHSLIRQGVDLEVWLLGKGPSRDELQVLVDHLGLRDRVRLLEAGPDPVEFYQALDLFVHCGVGDTLPIPVLEAMAMDVPLVSTQVMSLKKLIEKSNAGLLCPIGHIDRLADAVGRLLADEPLRQDLARNGRVLVEQEFSFGKRVAKVKAVYDHVLGLDRRTSRDEDHQTAASA